MFRSPCFHDHRILAHPDLFTVSWERWNCFSISGVWKLYEMARLFFTFMGIKMATDGVLRGLGIMRPFLVANMVNLAIRLSVALIFAPRFGIAFVWLAVPAGWFANFLISYGALRKSWPSDNCNCVINTNELL